MGRALALRPGVHRLGRGGTRLHFQEWKWEQTITGLNAEGNRLVKGLTDTAFVEEKKLLENMLNHFLETGIMLRLGK